MRQLLAGLVVSMGMWAGLARADDPKKDDPVVLPLTDGLVTFTPKERKLRVQYSYLGTSGLTFVVRAAAPLDEDTRFASFLEDNRLISGFEGTVSIGYDGRSGYLEALNKRMARLADAYSYVTGPSRMEKNGELTDWCAANNLRPCEQAKVLQRLLILLGGPDLGSHVDVNRQLWVELDKAVQRKGLATTTPAEQLQAQFDFAQAVVKAMESQAKACKPGALQVMPSRAIPTSPPYDDCSRDALTLRGLYKYRAAELDFEIQENKLTDEVWRRLVRLDSARMGSIADEVGTGKGKLTRFEAIVEHKSEINELLEEALKRLRGQTALEQRDLNLLALSGSQDPYWSLSGELSGSIDRLKAYQDSVATAQVDVTNYDLQYGVNGTLYVPSRGLHLNLRVGGESSQKTTLKQFERCEGLAGMTTDLTAKLCDPKANWVKDRLSTSPDPSAFVRVAIGWQLLNDLAKESEFVPGLELRAGLEQLGARQSVPQLALRLSLFATPLKDSLAGRVGIAISASVNLHDSMDGTMRRGDWIVMPMAFVGATTSALMGR